MRYYKHGKVYDTTTARVCAESKDGVRLYRKITGEFFAFNPNKKRNSITPLSYDDAESWGAKNLSREAAEKLFGKIEKDSHRVDFRAKPYRHTVEIIKRVSVRNEMSLSEVIDLAIEKAFDEEGMARWECLK